ncbi:hypothetical protein DFP72DRAFT_1060433 [Ephemerocybe angulata]|uniref:Uncharacterized protein n=1 Tax=Ephemerocybe angulata TaxID=980116 RepID=A0A8H6IF07_9AGAR|nr:hypothetical protein DFP72DRAFT_1060433 [Tulosesus angulatus]
MSIFGSPGITKAGLIVLCGTWNSYLGPKWLHDAGFTPSGMGKLLTLVDVDSPKNLYIAEEKVRSILAKKRIHSVTVDLWSWEGLWSWNTRLILSTILISGTGAIPYIPVIRTLPSQPFLKTWFYPCIRLVGCSLIVISVQIILQLRIIEEAYSRMRFIATKLAIHDDFHSLPSFWDPNKRSKDALRAAQLWSQRIPQQFGLSNTTNEFMGECPTSLSSFSFPLPYRSTHSLSTTARCTRWHPVTILLVICRIILIVGIGLSLWGYIGCFTVVQAIPKEAGSGAAAAWLGCEAALAVLRILLWGNNPDWDDVKPAVALRKLVKKESGKEEPLDDVLDWDLEMVTSANTMHALIVGVDSIDVEHYPIPTPVPDYLGGVGAEAMATYLKDTLLVPRNQVTVLRDAEATRGNVLEALENLAVRTSLKPHSPVLVYFATPAIFYEDKLHFVLPTPDSAYLTCTMDGKCNTTHDTGYIKKGKYDLLDEATTLGLLDAIDHEKTTNTVLILDVLKAKMSKSAVGLRGYTGLDPLQQASYDFRREMLGFLERESRIILAATRPHVGGIAFTQRLLEALRADPQTLAQMTYSDLVEKIYQNICDGKMTLMFQNTRLFNGLFAKKGKKGSARPVISVTYSDL